MFDDFKYICYILLYISSSLAYLLIECMSASSKHPDTKAKTILGLCRVIKYNINLNMDMIFLGFIERFHWYICWVSLRYILIESTQERNFFHWKKNQNQSEIF